MKTYLVFEPADGARTAEVAERILFVREKFSWTALIFAPFWLLWHCLWLGLFVWFTAVAIIGLGAWALNVPSTMATVAAFLPSLVVAFEGAELRRRKLLRRGYRDAGVAVGRDRDDAERRFFDRWVTRARPERPPAPAVTLAPASEIPIIGLFPEPGARR